MGWQTQERVVAVTGTAIAAMNGASEMTRMMETMKMEFVRYVNEWNGS